MEELFVMCTQPSQVYLRRVHLLGEVEDRVPFEHLSLTIGVQLDVNRQHEELVGVHEGIEDVTGILPNLGIFLKLLNPLEIILWFLNFFRIIVVDRRFFWMQVQATIATAG